MYVLEPYISLKKIKGAINVLVSQDTLKEQTKCGCQDSQCDDVDICVEVEYKRSTKTNVNLANMRLYAANYIKRNNRVCRGRKLGTWKVPSPVALDVTGEAWMSSYFGIQLKCQAAKVCIANFILSLQSSYEMSNYESVSPDFRSPVRC